MKKNIARYMLVAAVVFFLLPHTSFCDGESAHENISASRINSESHGLAGPMNDNFDRDESLCSDSIPVLSFDSFGSDSALFPINVLNLGPALHSTNTDFLPQEGGAAGGIPPTLEPVPPIALSDLMTQIESSLKTVKTAADLVLSTQPIPRIAETSPTTPAILVVPADSSQHKSVSPVDEKSKDKDPRLDKGPLPDDVDMTDKELEALHPMSDERELTPETGHDIKFSASMPLTGSMALVGRDYLTGINLVFDKFNRAGGLDKKYLIKYSTIDDRYISTEAKANIVKSSKNTPFFIGNFGSHLLSTVKNLLEKKEILMLFPTAGDMAFRNKDYRYLINLRPSMNAELRALIKYAINSQHRKKIAVFYEENQWGKSGLAAVESTLAEFGLAPCAKANYPSNTIAVMPAATEIIKSRPDAVICISTYRPTYNFIQLVLNEGFQHCLFLGLGPSTPMQQLLKKSRGVTIATTSVVPDPVKSKIPIVEAYRKDMTRYFPLREVSQYSLEGYIVGSIFVSALKQLESPYTIGKLMSFFEGLKRKDFGGFKINFSPKTRELSSRVWINKGSADDEWDDSFSE